MEILLARQPIFDKDRKLYGYELLHRSCRNRSFDGAGGDQASMEVLANTLLALGPEKVLKGRPGFINFPRDLLVSNLAFVMPPHFMGIEVLESVEPDDEVIAACRYLKSLGYCIALDDFVLNARSAPLLEFAGILKIDFRTTSRRERGRIFEKCQRPGLCMLAEKVETIKEFEAARSEGFSYFQGFFFERPAILARKDIPPSKVNLLRILSEVHNPDFDFGRIGRLIKQEMPLCYRLIRYVNSAAFGWRSRISSIQQAITLLGEKRLRNWLTLAAIPELALDKPDELAETAVLRARFCELTAPLAGIPHRRSDLFLVGMFSLLDVMIGRPIEELLDELCLAKDVRAALLGTLDPENAMSQVYRLVLAWEKSDWETVSLTAGQLGIATEFVAALYLEAAAWCSEITYAHKRTESDPTAPR